MVHSLYASMLEYVVHYVGVAGSAVSAVTLTCHSTCSIVSKRDLILIFFNRSFLYQHIITASMWQLLNIRTTT